jgi:hypothetical protein
MQQRAEIRSTYPHGSIDPKLPTGLHLSEPRADSQHMHPLDRRRRSRTDAHNKRGRTRRERGAAALEFALVAPLFFLVVFGGIEIGLMFRSHLAIQDMSRGAARVASIERDSADADREILQGIVSGSRALNGEVTKVIIFHATTLDATLPPSCIDGLDVPASQSGLCNAYDASFADVAAGTGAIETGLTSAERGEWQNLGIYIEYEYQYVTGFFDSITLSATSVEVVELDM